jgi:imidazole glycerol-phosphate synthase subunit HisF
MSSQGECQRKKFENKKKKMVRIIARLDVKPPWVVKPVHFEGLRKIGTPEELALKYYEQGADELFYIDIVASLYQREILTDYIKATSERIFIPFAVGGGVRSVEDFSKLFHIGVDKVLINTHALQKEPMLIDRAARIFGSQAVVVHIEAKKWGDQWECYSDCGRIRSGKDVIQWTKEVESMGAGEVLLSSVDMDGRKRGFDIELVRKVVDAVKMPVVAASGAGKLEDIKKVILEAAPEAVAIGSLLHYNTTTIGEIKEYLKDNGIRVSL